MRSLIDMFESRVKANFAGVDGENVIDATNLGMLIVAF